MHSYNEFHPEPHFGKNPVKLRFIPFLLSLFCLLCPVFARLFYLTVFYTSFFTRHKYRGAHRTGEPPLPQDFCIQIRYDAFPFYTPMVGRFDPSRRSLSPHRSVGGGLTQPALQRTAKKERL